MLTILTERGQTVLDAAPAPGVLWLDAAEAEAASGWALKPEGLCRDEVCVPLPRGREAAFAKDGKVELAAVWRHLGKPAAASAAGDVWVLGEAAAERGARLASLEAPDFALPDLDGHLHSLSEMRGRKTLLVTWASW